LVVQSRLGALIRSVGRALLLAPNRRQNQKMPRRMTSRWMTWT
jgi:hypothetical protein